jgi:hypothetical protein
MKRRLQQNFGRVPDLYYAHGDMEQIRSYFDFRRETGRDAFLLDDVTWNDLDLDRVFRRINAGRCTSGEQVLYHLLRSPAQNEADYRERERMIRFAEGDPERRLRVEMILARMGCSRRADLSHAFYPDRHGPALLIVYLLLFLFLLAGIVCAAWSRGAIVWPLMTVIVNPLVHELGRRRSQREYDTVNYTVAMVFAMQHLRRMHDGELDGVIAPAYGSLDRLHAVIRTGGISTVTDDGGPGDLLTTLTLLDLIAFEFLKNKLGRCHEDVFVIHEYLGRLDAAIAVASYRRSVAAYTVPLLDFAPEKPAGITALGLVHPLLEDAVPNDLITDHPILITGSNASGKSTYLKTVALAAVMAQSICTCLADSYRANAFRIYSSMAISDNLLAGESYYIVETRSLKRILDHAREEGPVFCVIDEVLRGTNTIERIAASSEVLQALAESGALCLAATHDIELCDLLGGAYRLFHFEEQVGEDEMLFDYRLREGKATSRNAIELLRLIGFDQRIVDRANERANRYLESGAWKDRKATE